MKKINVRSKVKYAGIEDGKATLTLSLTPEQESALDRVYEEVDTEGCASTPTKVDREGKLYFKAVTRYAVKVYENGKESDSISVGDIGEGSEVVANVSIGISKYRGRAFLVAYLSAINIIDMVWKKPFNPFDNLGEI
jgi:hypothetical protein|nr:MAG TPA: Oxysterol-binding protein [Caudoviricetes sp.]